MQQARAPESFDKEAAFVEMCQRTMLDGHSYYTQAAFRHWVGMKAGQVMEASAAERGRRFRALRALATRVGDEYCAEVLRLVTRAQRLFDQQESAEPAAQQALDELAEWERTPVSNPLAG